MIEVCSRVDVGANDENYSVNHRAQVRACSISIYSIMLYLLRNNAFFSKRGLPFNSEDDSITAHNHSFGEKAGHEVQYQGRQSVLPLLASASCTQWMRICMHDNVPIFKNRDHWNGSAPSCRDGKHIPQSCLIRFSDAAGSILHCRVHTSLQ